MTDEEPKKLTPEDEARLRELAEELFEKLRMQGLSRDEIRYVIDEAVRLRKRLSVN
jgi:D-alanine-D-alanine ligase-like ATP-grasp enzyme